MIFIALSVLCGVTVSVVLKLATKHHVDMRQAIAGNYAVAGLLAAGLFHPAPELLLRVSARSAWPVLIALGILLPAIFLVEAESVRRVGIVKTGTADRLSLVLPLIAAFTLFGEAFNWQRGVGVTLGLAAIACLAFRKRDEKRVARGDAGWTWLLGVFLGGGVIDILFKRLALLTRVPFTDMLFAIFALAFVLATAVVVWLYHHGRAAWRWRHAGTAIVLGTFNFGDILFYVQAQRHLPGNPALVFSVEDIGVIALATLVGAWGFRERLEHWNRAGVALAIVAVAVLAMT